MKRLINNQVSFDRDNSIVKRTFKYLILRKNLVSIIQIPTRTIVNKITT